MSERLAFVRSAEQGEATIAELCRRFGISRRCGYKWLGRYRAEGVAGLEERSRRPKRSPRQTTSEIESAVVSLRAEHPVWGGRKLRRVLVEDGYRAVPATSTITDILRRHGLLDPDASAKHRPHQRFERDAPNELWQMDFKGHFALVDGQRCHPLTILDDHSRFNVALVACADERTATVQRQLERVFTRFGLPEAMLMDNGSPWGNDIVHPHTPLTAWLMRHQVTILHGRPYHPQTQGKEERFHRTLKAEVLHQPLVDMLHAQSAFDAWQQIYNHRRPHDALDLDVPAARYRPSSRPMPAHLPPVEYDQGSLVRRVGDGGRIRYRGRFYRVGKAFRGMCVALIPTTTDGLLDVHFCSQRIARIDLHTRMRVYPV